MSKEVLSSNGVHIAGNFQVAAGLGSNWDPSTLELQDPDGDSIYEVSVNIPPGVYYYKYINGNNWGQKPELPSADCSVHDGGGNYNRELTVGNTDISLPVGEFDSCLTQITFSVDMQHHSIAPEGVFVTGDFVENAGYGTNWSTDAIPLTDVSGSGVYQAKVYVNPDTYQFRYVNGTTLEQLSDSCAVDDGNGNMNRVIEALSANEALPIYCFNTCTFCDPALDTDYDTYWWNDVVFYEIFVRSFHDSDGDGIGDFQGLIQKLDYLNDGDPNTHDDLGIKGIWLMPMTESPTYHGYDATNYYTIEPDYGTMADFEAFLDSAHARGIYVIMDLILNHCSNQHPWFTQSASGPNSPFRDWFIWSETQPSYPGPWGQQVWHPYGGEYFYGLFWGGMPDLNYDNPDVKEEMFNIVDFWLNKGLDGFRLDAIKYLDEDFPNLEDTPETFTILEEFRMFYDTVYPDIFTVGEVWSPTSAILPYTQPNNRLHTCFDFSLASNIIAGVDGGSPTSLANHLSFMTSSYRPIQYSTFLTNHDMNRVFEIFGLQADKMKLATAIYLSLPGVPFVYYGEEVGMTGSGIDENKRKPMQWNAGSNGGFTTGTPWYPLNSNYTLYNVQSQENDPHSILNRHRRMIRIRNSQAALRRGNYLSVSNSNASLFSFARVYEEEAVIHVSNFSANPLPNIRLSLSASSLPEGTYQVKELLTGELWGTIGIDAQGGFSDWQPSANQLGGRSTWLLQLGSNLTDTESLEQQPPTIALYPNPTTNFLHIESPFSSTTPLTLSLSDAQGRLLYRASHAQASIRLDMRPWPKGTYFLSLQSEHDTYTYTVVRQ